MLVNIREERPEDIAAIHDINVKAFAQPQEAELVDTLRKNRGVLLSLVATLNGQVVGHILYSPVTVGAGQRKLAGAGLGPMSVLPEYQRKGIGSKLVEFGNERARESGCPFIVVVGHPEYYPRFGFRPAHDYGIECQWDVPECAFMVLVLDEEKVKGISGLATYRAEFSSIA